MTAPSARPGPRWLAPWWSLPLVVAAVALGTAAGLWQLSRAAEKRDLAARFAAGGSAGALRGLVSDADAAGLRYRTLRLAGRYDPDHQVLLDNMSYQGRPGYQVLTPLRTRGGTVMVNRGWVPASGDRTVLPDLRVGSATREVAARLGPFPQPAIRLERTVTPAGATWPRRLLFPTSRQLSAELGIPLRGYQLLLDPAAADGYVRDWHPGGMDAERHVAYAVQWLGLALTVVVIYVVLVFRNRGQAS